MKKGLRYIVFAIASLLLYSCGKDNGAETPSNNFTLNRDDIIGCWKVIQAKYDEGAKMTDWAFEDTYATFEENGLYKGEGYFGNGEGTYSVSGNVITTKVDNVPFIVYEVTGLEEDKANLIATLQSNQMKIWMVVQKAEEYIDEQPKDVYPEDSFFSDEKAVVAIINNLYSGIVEFVKLKQTILNKVENSYFKDLNPSSSEIQLLWTEAYDLLSKINMIYQELRNLEGSYDVEDYTSHVRVLRGFMGYNLACLWGNVPFIQYVSQGEELTPRDASDILDLSIKDLSVRPDYKFSTIQENYYFNTTISVIVRAECYLTLGNKSSAFELLENNTSFPTPSDIYLQLIDGTESMPIYYNRYYDVLKDEAKGDLSADQLMLKWNQEALHYDHWLFLKRIGKAQEVSGCEDYQLLLPIPQIVIDANRNIKQNPGY